MADLQPAYDSFLKSEFGRHVISELQKIADSDLRQAATMPTPESAYGLIKQAGGVIKAIDHFSTGAALK